MVGESFRTLTDPIGALQNRPSLLRQDCDPLRWELAITGLDWFLTPNPRS